MTGPTDSGKTFSLGLIRRLCREAPAKRFRPIAIDLTALALTRDCVEVARTVGSWLRLDQFVLPRVDTSESRIGQRLVAELTVARELSENIVPTSSSSITWTKMSRRASSILWKSWRSLRPMAGCEMCGLC